MSELKGPLGLWNFPILNLLRGFFQKSASRGGGGEGSKFSPVMKNIENITWTDWKGKERNITVHREIEQVER